MRKLIAAMLALLMMTIACAETAVINPWTETTPDGLMQSLGLSFDVPEGAENVAYRMLENEMLAEMQFDLNAVHFNARIKPAVEFEDISGMYYEWASDEPAGVGWCEGRLLRAGDGESTADLLLWFDAAPGLMYSLSALSPEGTDLLSIADAVYRITQSDAYSPSSEALAEILSGLTYAGTAGSSLKEAIAACRLTACAAEIHAAECEPEECAAEAISMLPEEVLPELAFHLDGIRALMQQVFRDFDSLRPLFDDAGCLSEMEAVLAAEDVQAHFYALMDALP